MRCTAVRSSTSWSISGRNRSTYRRWFGVELSADEPARPVRAARAARTVFSRWTDDVRGRLPDVRAARARGRTRCALGRPRVRHRLAGRDHRRSTTATASYPDFDHAAGRDSVTRTTSGRRRRCANACTCDRALPALPQHHRRRRPARHCDGSRERIPLEVHEVPSGTQVFDWTVPGRVEHPRAHVAGRTDGASSTSTSRTSTSSATASRCEPEMSLDELRPHLHSARRATGLDPLPHLVLLAGLGLLSRRDDSSARSETALRGRDRQHARAGLAHVRRVLAPRRDRRRGAPLDPRLPPVARERQPLGHRRCSPSSPAMLAERAATALVPFPVHPGHHRLDRLAGRE